MEKKLNCRDVGTNCDFFVCGKTEEELLAKAAYHARSFHNMNQIPRDVFEKARSAIHDVERC